MMNILTALPMSMFHMKSFVWNDPHIDNFVLKTDVVYLQGHWGAIMSKIYELGASRLIECYLVGGYLKDVRDDEMSHTD